MNAAKIKITETLLKQARALRESPDPEEAIAAAEWEVVIEDELERLKKQQSTRKREPAGAHR